MMSKATGEKLADGGNRPLTSRSCTLEKSSSVSLSGLVFCCSRSTESSVIREGIWEAL